MPVTAAIIFFALFLGAVYLVITPFLVPPEAELEESEDPRLETQKNRVIDAIREIDMDYQTGKLSDGDYALLRSRYTAAAAEILSRIDEDTAVAETVLEQPEAIENAPEAFTPAPDDETERQIAEYKEAVLGSSLLDPK